MVPLTLIEIVVGMAAAVAALILIVYEVTHYGRRRGPVDSSVLESLGYPLEEARNLSSKDRTEPVQARPLAKLCRYCGAEIPRDSRYCMECGLPALHLGAD